MSQTLFTEEECGNILNEYLSVDASEFLSIIREPAKNKHELHSLYYQLICHISPGIPPSLEHLADVPLLDIHSEWQPANGQLLPVGRLYSYLRNIQQLIMDEPDITISDLMRPKKNRSFNIISSLLNFLLFVTSCKYVVRFPS